jgi:hypothetical protein
MAVITCLMLMLSVAGSPAKPASRPATTSVKTVPAQPATPPIALKVQPVTLDGDDLHVLVEIRRYPVADPNRGTKLSSQLESAVKSRLERAKFRVLTPAGETTKRNVAGKPGADPDLPAWRASNAPVLRIGLNVLFLETGSRVAVNAQTWVTRPVRPAEMPNAGSINVSLWNTEPVMQSVPATRWEEEARKLVLQQVETFIIAAQPSVAIEKVVENKIRSTSGVSFVAFRGSSEFHRPDCPVARTIGSENLVIYKTREEALAVGKQPCKSCNP